MNKIRLFLIKENEDCQIVNAFLESLEEKSELSDIDYEVNYDFHENSSGILVTVEWEE